MREIKFRAWDTERKEMFYPNWILTSTGCNVDKMEHPKHGELHRKDNTAILMQYTGLKDKNGKEIYEGDIVHVKGKLPVVGEVDGLQQVFYTGCSFAPNIITKAKMVEVIGNAYENPELLEEQI